MTRRERATRMAPEERRAAIVASTLPLVLKHGPGVSTRMIAEAAGVAEGTIFRVFPDKDALMQQVLLDALDIEQSLRELAAIDRSLPLRDRLVATTETAQRRMANIFALIAALGWNIPQPDDEREAANQADQERYRAVMIDVIGADADQLRVPPEELVRVLSMLMFSATHPRIAEGEPLKPEQIVSIVLDGLLLPRTGES